MPKFTNITVFLFEHNALQNWVAPPSWLRHSVEIQNVIVMRSIRLNILFFADMNELDKLHDIYVVLRLVTHLGIVRTLSILEAC